MISQRLTLLTQISLALGMLVTSCQNPDTGPQTQGIEIKFLVGSALTEFCQTAAAQLNQQQPKLSSGQAYYLTCEAMGSGDVVTKLANLVDQLQQGILNPQDPQFPALISLDGDIYHSQLLYQLKQISPGQTYIPDITESPLIAYSPMVFMVPKEVAVALADRTDLYTVLGEANTYQDLDSNAPNLPIYFVQTAPTRSNSGLQTLVSQFVSVSGKRPEELTIADIDQYQDQVQKIQSKVTRYGISTNTLAHDMVANGPYWASLGSVYESSVIKANSTLTPNQSSYQAIYPRATFNSNMRAIKPNAPWLTPEEQEAANQIIEFLRSESIQQIAISQGLRPGVPGIALGPQFSPEFGVEANPQYDSLRSPEPEVVERMLDSWQQYAKKPSLVVLIVDSSGSMKGNKLPAVQNTLRYYVNNLGPKETLALIDFDSVINEPVLVDGTEKGKARGIDFINNLVAHGGTRLYDAALFGRNWLQQNIKPEAINAIVILTDGEDSESTIALEQLNQELQQSGFNSDDRIAFFTIGYGKEGEFNPQALQQIAQSNGGYYRLGDPNTISTLMSDLQMEF